MMGNPEPNPDRPKLSPEIEQTFEETDRKSAESYGQIEEMMDLLDTAARRLREAGAPREMMTGTESLVFKVSQAKAVVTAPPPTPDDDEDKKA